MGPSYEWEETRKFEHAGLVIFRVISHSTTFQQKRHAQKLFTTAKEYWRGYLGTNSKIPIKILVAKAL